MQSCNFCVASYIVPCYINSEEKLEEMGGRKNETYIYKSKIKKSTLRPRIVNKVPVSYYSHGPVHP